MVIAFIRCGTMFRVNYLGGITAMSIVRHFIPAALLAGLLSSAAHAIPVTFYDNTGQTSANNKSVASPVAGDGPLAESFSVGNVLNATLTSVSLVLNESGGGGSFIVTLNSDLGGAPSGVSPITLGTFFDSGASAGLVGGGTLYTLAAVNVALMANTNYWIVATDSAAPSNDPNAPPVATTTAQWLFSANSDGTGVAGQTGLFNAQTHNKTSGPYEMALTGTGDPIPEPATLALLGLGVAGIGWVRSRRKAPTQKG